MFYLLLTRTQSTQDYKWDNITKGIYDVNKDILFELDDSSRKGHEQQVAQLSQRDRAAGWVSYGQKWKTATMRQYFTDIIGLPFNHCNVIGPQSNRI